MVSQERSGGQCGQSEGTRMEECWAEAKPSVPLSPVKYGGVQAAGVQISALPLSSYLTGYLPISELAALSLIHI